ncbi:MAG TPA: hypothetical protein VKN18_16880 [Blastocatellia bacterium]|nr:hypothetical protein [Blastocatellia bacterium]
MRYRIISLLAMVAMTACGIYVILYRWEHPYRGVFKIFLRRWWILLGVLLFALIAVLGWHRHHRQHKGDPEDEPEE